MKVTLPTLPAILTADDPAGRIVPCNARAFALIPDATAPVPAHCSGDAGFTATRPPGLLGITSPRRPSRFQVNVL